MLEKHTEVRVFILVKTYPTPSLSYDETVCTAGITGEGKWIRLYPIPFRHLDENMQYKKYQWIKVEVTKHKKDQRKESYSPNSNSIVLLNSIDTENKWSKRKEIVIPLAKRSLEEITFDYEQNRTSLGIFKPKEIIDFYWRETDPKWPEKYIEASSQMKLFGPERKELEKIPFEFRYKFHCNDSLCKGHDISIVDWEIYQAYRSWRYRYTTTIETLNKIKEKWLEDMFKKSRDSFFIVGTRHPWPTFLILGVFWPPK